VADGIDRREEERRPTLRRAARVKHRGRYGRFWFIRDALAVVVTGLFLLAVFSQVHWLLSVHEMDARILVEVPEGASVREIASILEDAGLVGDAGKFVQAARVFRFTDRLQAGAYEFGPQFSELDVLMALRYGEVAGRHLTIPEGYRAAEIALLLDSALGIDAGEFMDLVHDPDFITELGVTAPSLEGYLHPDTYRMRLNTTGRDVIRIMVAQTRRVFDDRRTARAESLGMSQLEVLTLASIIEAEAMFDRERSRISAVYHNRLESGWRLEADPTVRYATGNYRRKLYYGDLRAESPYNTYRNTGLPPGPISNPGRASIEAALYPLQENDDFFFVANGDGTHTFSRTFNEHVRARERINRESAPKPPQTGEFSLDSGESG